MSEQSNNLVPKLRFPEFQDAGEWELKKLGDICDYWNGGSHEGAITENGEYFLISLNSIDIDGNLKPDMKRLSNIDNSLQKNDLVMVLSDVAHGNFLGLTDIIPTNKYVLNQRMAGLRLKKPNSGSVAFLRAFINKKQKYFKQKGQGSSQLNLAKSAVTDFPVLFPNPEEQQKIADCLSSIDELITVQTKKIDALKDHKKGLMQQLFPAEGETVPKLRFPEFQDAREWKQSKLGEKDVSTFVKERTPLQNLSLDSYVSTENLLSDYAGVTNAAKLPPSGSFTRFKEGDVLISNIRPYLKKVWAADKKGASSNDVIVIRSQPNISDSFLKFLLKNDNFIDYIMKGAKGVKMPRGDISLIKEYPVAFPNSDEQQKVADCLSSIDELIAAQTQQLKVLKAQKKGLMQQLFPAPLAE